MVDKNERYKNKIKLKFNDEWEILSEYKDKSTKVLVKHNKCNSQPYEIYPGDLLRKKPDSICKYCASRHGLERFKEMVKNNPRKDGSEYEVISDTYISLHSKVKMKHLVCNNVYEVEPILFLGNKTRRYLNGRRCPYCAGHKMTGNTIMKKIEETDPEYRVISNLSEKFLVTDKFQVKHLKCNSIFTTSYTNFIYNGSRCTHCNIHGKSNSEEELYNYIKSIDESAERNKRFYFDGKMYREADIIIESRKLIFEYDGLYWHAEGVADTKYNLLEKTEFFNKLGYSVIHIFEDEWLFKKDIIKLMIRSLITCKLSQQCLADDTHRRS